MDLYEIILISIALAMDAAAIATTNAMCNTKTKNKIFLVMALSFGIFQGLMPMIGYFTAGILGDNIIHFGKGLAGVVLIIIGGKMLFEAFKNDDENYRPILSLKIILAQSVACSIDALAVGIGFAAANIDILFPIISIGAITAVISFAASQIGIKIGDKLNKWAGVLGGVILIAIGIKTFL